MSCVIQFQDFYVVIYSVLQKVFESFRMLDHVILLYVKLFHLFWDRTESLV